MARRFGNGVIVVALVAILGGCVSNPSAAPSGSAGPSPTSASTPGTPTSAPTAAPTVEPTAGVDCSGPLPPTLASVAELADASCYGTTELTIDGWLGETGIQVDVSETKPSWTMPWAALFPVSPTAGDWLVDFLMVDHVPGPRLAVVTNPDSGIDLSGIGRWVRVQGHFNDPAASACREVDPNSGWETRDCSRLFVVTGLEGIPSSGPACPTESPMSLATFFAADLQCVLGHEVRIAGWEDAGEGFGGVGFAYPIDTGSLKIADSQLTFDRWESGRPEPIVFPWLVAGDDVRFGHSDRRVIVTAELGHPAAAECRPARYAWEWSPPDSWARHYCGRLLVITGVRAAD